MLNKSKFDLITFPQNTQNCPCRPELKVEKTQSSTSAALLCLTAVIKVLNWVTFFQKVLIG